MILHSIFKVITKKFTILAASLKCWECTFANCLTGINYFGLEKVCSGEDPVCVKQELGEDYIKRTCQHSIKYVNLTTLDSQCLEYNGLRTCYCTKSKCNSAFRYTPRLIFSVSLFVVFHNSLFNT